MRCVCWTVADRHCLKWVPRHKHTHTHTHTHTNTHTLTHRHRHTDPYAQMEIDYIHVAPVCIVIFHNILCP